MRGKFCRRLMQVWTQLRRLEVRLDAAHAAAVGDAIPTILPSGPASLPPVVHLNVVRVKFPHRATGAAPVSCCCSTRGWRPPQAIDLIRSMQMEVSTCATLKFPTRLVANS
jgi:hypothetical protein